VTPNEQRALVRAEETGVYEYSVNGKYMEYWSFYGPNEGWFFVRYDLEEGREAFRGANIPFDGTVPKFLLTGDGATKYNYMTG